jgi:antitoxin component of RelBE/YafQ-DinJ toxin-antitoxin module
MTAVFRCRIEKPLLDKANRVTKRPCTSSAETVRIFVMQMARTGKVPPELDAGQEYAIARAWEKRTATLEGYHDKSKPDSER